MAWLVPGYLAGKAAYRDLGSFGFSFFFMMMGWMGYFMAWFMVNEDMVKVHGLDRLARKINPRGVNLGAKFFGED
jgi:hypothetical protein